MPALRVLSWVRPNRFWCCIPNASCAPGLRTTQHSGGLCYSHGDTRLSTARRALVLAGGGYAASAWEIGLITGMADAGVDVRNADLFVGTSSGARVVLHLASGVSLEEVFQGRVRPSPQPAERPPVVDWVRLRGGLARAKEAGSPTEILRRIGSLALAAAGDANGSARRENRSSAVADADMARTKSTHYSRQRGDGRTSRPSSER